MSTAYQLPAMPLLTKIALWLTTVTCLLFFIAFVTFGKLLFVVALLGWFIASFCGLFGIARAKPKNKVINVLLFSLVGPLLAMLLLLMFGRYI